MDKEIATAFLKCLQTQIYLSENYIVKVGEVLTGGIFLLEGQVHVLAIRS